MATKNPFDDKYVQSLSSGSEQPQSQMKPQGQDGLPGLDMSKFTGQVPHPAISALVKSFGNSWPQMLANVIEKSRRVMPVSKEVDKEFGLPKVGVQDPLSGVVNRVKSGVPIEPFPLSDAERQQSGAQLVGDLGAMSIPIFGASKLTANIPETANMLQRILMRSPEGAAIGSGTSRPGDEVSGALWGAGLSQIPEIPALAKGLFGAGKHVAKKVGDISRVPGTRKKIKQLGTDEQEIAQQIAQQEEAYGTQPKLESNIGKLESEQQTLRQNIQDTPVKSSENMLPSPGNEQLLQTAEQKAAQHEQNLGVATDDIQQYLNPKANHDEVASHGIKKGLKAEREGLNENYETLKSNLAERNATISNDKDMKQLMNDLGDAYKEHGVKSPEVQKLALDIESVGKEQTIPGDKLFEMWQDAKQGLRELNKAQFETGITQEARTSIENKIPDVKANLQKLQEKLDSLLTPEEKEILADTTHKYATRVVPLWKERAYWNLQNDTRISKNIADSLDGTSEGKGVMREMAMKDPDANKAILGQHYAKDPSKIHEIPDMHKPYLDNDSDLQKLVSDHKIATDDLHGTKTTKGSLGELKTAKDEFKTAQIKQAATKKSWEEFKTRQENRGVNVKKLGSLEKQYNETNAKIKEIQSLKDKKGITLEEKMKLEKELSGAYKNMRNAVGVYLGIKGTSGLIGLLKDN